MSRRALANGVDIDSGHELLWLMRVLETHSEELWYEQYRRDLARDESRGKWSGLGPELAKSLAGLARWSGLPMAIW